MGYNFITNINGCIESATQLMNGNLNLVYYSHIPVVVISLILGFFVIKKNKSAISARSLFFLSIIFSIWIICNLMAWVSSNSLSIMFFWSLIGMFDFLIFASSLFLLYTYESNEDVPMWLKLLIGILFLPILILTPTKFAITAFDYTNCTALDNLFGGYLYLSLFIVSVITVIVAIRKFFTTPLGNRKQIFLMSLGVVLFLASVFGTYYISDTFEYYSIEIYGVFAMTFFMAFIAYLIVKFKAFDIKLIGAQALVWALVILVGSQFFYQANMPTSSLILTAITLLVSAIVGLVIVRGVKKEIALRKELEIANNNQQSLIHFISHQIKGFFTKSKMIFSGLLEGDFGEVTPTVLDMAKTGLDSDNNAVAMVQDILGASNLKKGTTDYSFKLVNLVDIVNKVANNFSAEIVKKGLKFELDIVDKMLPVMADETQITQVFKNLMDNSLRYTPTGEIKVSLKVSPDDKKKVLFMVKDTGVGLSDKDKEKLFTEGGKGEESLKVNTNSTGYGLYIVKKIVETHKGKIWAESAGRGHGSKFLVELKLSA